MSGPESLVPEFMVHTIAAYQPISRALWDEQQEYQARREAWAALPPEEKARQSAAARLAFEARLVEERDVPRVALTLESLMESRGWSIKEATHLVQTYCDCGDGSDGWEHCQHYDHDMAQP